MYGDIQPRTTCPAGPKGLEAKGGDWTPAYAHATDHSQDAVPNFKDMMVMQTAFKHADVSMQWALHQPFQAEQNPDLLFPLVIYLHGGAETRMDSAPGFLDNRHAKSFFASSQSLLTASNLEDRPTYIIAPYCDAKAANGTKCAFGGAEWASNGYGSINAKLNGDGSPYGAAVEALVEQLIANQQIDAARIYVTGPSMGGGGSWDFAARRPDLVAAAVPLAGHPLSDSALNILASHKVPVWSHHGAKDNKNSYQAAKSAIQSLANKGGCAWQTTYHPSQDLGLDDPADSNPDDATHNIWARAYTNPELWDWVFAQQQPRSNSTSASSSSSSSTSSSSSSSSSSGIVTPGKLLQANNHYLARKANTAPVIDGEIDDAWTHADWMEMSVAWTGFENLTRPSSDADFKGKYKAVWTEDHLYLLLDITDDVIHTNGAYYQIDTVEVFIDEDQSGGSHAQNHSAFAYHVNYSTKVTDLGGEIDGHVTAQVKTEGTRHIWEMKIEIYADHNGYNRTEQAAARVALQAGKIMGFTPSYIDNDGNGRREHFMSSVDTEGHQRNRGYSDAGSFGSIELVE